VGLTLYAITWPTIPLITSATGFVVLGGSGSARPNSWCLKDAATLVFIVTTEAAGKESSKSRRDHPPTSRNQAKCD
jgi:hypothetical protein